MHQIERKAETYDCVCDVYACSFDLGQVLLQEAAEARDDKDADSADLF
jgi:hypothetical protein